MCASMKKREKSCCVIHAVNVLYRIHMDWKRPGHCQKPWTEAKFVAQ